MAGDNPNQDVTTTPSKDNEKEKEGKANSGHRDGRLGGGHGGAWTRDRDHGLDHRRPHPHTSPNNTAPRGSSNNHPGSGSHGKDFKRSPFSGQGAPDAHPKRTPTGPKKEKAPKKQPVVDPSGWQEVSTETPNAGKNKRDSSSGENKVREGGGGGGDGGRGGLMPGCHGWSCRCKSPRWQPTLPLETAPLLLMPSPPSTWRMKMTTWIRPSETDATSV